MNAPIGWRKGSVPTVGSGMNGPAKILVGARTEENPPETEVVVGEETGVVGVTTGVTTGGEAVMVSQGSGRRSKTIGTMRSSRHSRSGWSLGVRRPRFMVDDLADGK